MNRNEIIDYILKLEDWKDIEYILQMIWNRRNIVFQKWLRRVKDKASEQKNGEV